VAVSRANHSKGASPWYMVIVRYLRVASEYQKLSAVSTQCCTTIEVAFPDISVVLSYLGADAIYLHDCTHAT
jgi:hypothetical protein